MDTLVQTAVRRMTSDEFVAWALAQPDGRYELEDGKIVKMAAERARHNLSKAAVRRALEDALRAAGLPNTVFADGMVVVINDAVSREPDAIVCVGSGHDPELIEVTDPLILVEVLSPTTAKTDLGVKVTEYFSLATVRHYLIVDVGDRRVIHHARGMSGLIDRVVCPDGTPLVLKDPDITLDVTRLLA